VLPFAPSLDTVGFFAATAAEMASLWIRSFGEPSSDSFPRAAHFRIPADDSTALAIHSAAEKLRADGKTVEELDPPEGWHRLTAAARTINAYEGARTHAERYREFGERMGHRLAELIRGGLAMSEGEYQEALACVSEMRGVVAKLLRHTPRSLALQPPGQPR